VHAGREEFLFCWRAIGKRPTRWFDVQIAAGMVGMEYPSSYGNLVTRILGKSIPKGETRTDWRRRPLSSRQLEYALVDVEHLEDLRDHLKAQLDRLGRTDWLASELATWQDDLQQEELLERWRRVSGISGLSNRSLAIVRELWRWREAEAERTDLPPRRILRDDLLTELARRGTADPQRIRAVRGLQRRDITRRLPQISECIGRALDLPESELPQRTRRNHSTHASVVAQLLSTALSSICRQQQIAPSLVGTVQDMRELVDDRLQTDSGRKRKPPALTQGWRAEVVGRQVDDLLEGKLSIRIADPTSAQPLVFEPFGR
jgi:ribonuclease D